MEIKKNDRALPSEAAGNFLFRRVSASSRGISSRARRGRLRRRFGRWNELEFRSQIPLGLCCAVVSVDSVLKLEA